MPRKKEVAVGGRRGVRLGGGGEGGGGRVVGETYGRG